MNVLVCGSRDWLNRFPIERALVALYSERVMFHNDKALTIIHGNCRGADKIADAVGRDMQAVGWRVIVKPYAAKWSQFGRGAGPIRNQEMLTDGKPDIVFAFHPHIRESKGTRDMITRAKGAGVPVRVIEK